MADVIIRISDKKAVQMLKMYPKKAQIFLVETAVIDYFGRYGAMHIIDLLDVNGFSIFRYKKSINKKSHKSKALPHPLPQRHNSPLNYQPIESTGQRNKGTEPSQADHANITIFGWPNDEDEDQY